MRFGSTAKVLAKCMLKYYRISECRGRRRVGNAGPDDRCASCLLQDMKEDAVEVEAGGEWDPSSFEHDPVAWMSCGARMRELWKAAEQRFQVG